MPRKAKATRRPSVRRRNEGKVTGKAFVGEETWQCLCGKWNAWVNEWCWACSGGKDRQSTK